MNTPQLKEWSERQQVLAVILIAGLVIGMLWFLALYPTTRECRDLETRIASKKNLLAQKGLLRDEETLQKMLQQEEAFYKSLLQEWMATADRLAAFPNQRELAADRVGHIDFKVALANNRRQLGRKSQETGIRIPFDLGFQDSVNSTEDPRQLVIQLRTVEKIVELAFDLKFSAVRDIRPIAPLLHRTAGEGEGYLEEYPVLVELNGTLENLYDLFTAVLEPEHVFFMKNLRVESAASSDRPDLLTIRVVLSAPVFLKDPSELKPVPRKTVWRAGPKGA